MNIAGIIKNSFVDYPGKIAVVLFTSGCNLDCWYCHNSELIKKSDESVISMEELETFLQKRVGFVDAVVFSGGEPTLQDELKQTMKWVKDMGYLVKLDTNGLEPDILQDLINEELLDYIAMDIKAPLDKYDKVVTHNTDMNKIKRSIEIIMSCGVDYEFRTTVAPTLEIDDFYSIGQSIKGAKKFSIQQYVRPERCTLNTLLMPFTKNQLLEIKEICEPFVDSVVVKGT